VQSCRFHHEIYSLRALERCLEVFGGVARLELAQELPHYRITVEGADPGVEAEVAGELSNYALALTIEEKRPSGHARGPVLE
jgi:hypothetical protein